jgi:L-arabinokinase
MDIPCLAASNFLWDWIYEPLITDEDFRNSTLMPLRAGYSKMTCWMRYPFYHNSSMLNKITDVSLVVRKVEHAPEELRKELRLSTDRRMVYIAFRGGLDQSVIATAAKKSPDFLFLIADEPKVPLPSNVKYIQPFPKYSFADVINMCDVVVGKPGYGLVSTCVACKKRLLFPPRSGFREDDVLMKEAEQFIPVTQIPYNDFLSGNWNDYLINFKDMPRNVIKTDGALECSDIIASYF